VHTSNNLKKISTRFLKLDFARYWPHNSTLYMTIRFWFVPKWSSWNFFVPCLIPYVHGTIRPWTMCVLTLRARRSRYWTLLHHGRGLSVHHNGVDTSSMGRFIQGTHDPRNFVLGHKSRSTASVNHRMLGFIQKGIWNGCTAPLVQLDTWVQFSLRTTSTCCLISERDCKILHGTEKTLRLSSRVCIL
jgi:hypothetical protein